MLPGPGCGTLGWGLVLARPQDHLRCERNPEPWGSPGLSSLAVCLLVRPGHSLTPHACTELDVTSHIETTLSWLVTPSLLTCITLAAPPKKEQPLLLFGEGSEMTTFSTSLLL